MRPLAGLGSTTESQPHGNRAPRGLLAPRSAPPAALSEACGTWSGFPRCWLRATRAGAEGRAGQPISVQGACPQPIRRTHGGRGGGTTRAGRPLADRDAAGVSARPGPPLLGGLAGDTWSWPARRGAQRRRTAPTPANKAREPCLVTTRAPSYAWALGSGLRKRLSASCQPPSPNSDPLPATAQQLFVCLFPPGGLWRRGSPPPPPPSRGSSQPTPCRSIHFFNTLKACRPPLRVVGPGRLNGTGPVSALYLGRGQEKDETNT